MQYLSLLIPIAYLTILLTSLATFSSLYRARKLRHATSLAPYFPSHTQRNIYLSLLHLPDGTKVPDTILRAALLARAVEDIHRILEIRQRKPPLQTLLAKGIVGDEIWQRLLRAEQEMELEVRDVVSEANALSGGTWGQTIFQSANEMAQNAILKKKVEAVRKTVEVEKKAWEKTRERARLELEGESVPAPTTATAAAPVSAAGKTAKTASSDEDAVLVEPPSNLDGVAAGVGGSVRNKKKKGKK